MNGNVTAEFHWLPACGSHSSTSEVHRERGEGEGGKGRDGAAIGLFAHPSDEGGGSVRLLPLYGSRAGTGWLRSGCGSPPESMAAGIALESGGEAETCQRW